MNNTFKTVLAIKKLEDQFEIHKDIILHEYKN